MKKIFPFGKLTVIAAFLLFHIPFALGQSTNLPPSEPAAGQTLRQLEISFEPYAGDFDQMLERRLIRVLAPYSRSLYFNDKGRERGISAENIRNFETWLNKKYAKKLKNRPITVYIIPTTRDKLLANVSQGLGDIAVGDLTVTEERLRTVDFVSPEMGITIRELVVTGPQSPAIQTIEDLSGKMVHVRKSSSYYESLERLNQRFKEEGKPLATIVIVPDALEDEDMMEMLSAGLLEIIIVDDWEAKMWAQILPKIKVNENAVLREGGRIGWATRKQSPKLDKEILDFCHEYLKKHGKAGYRLKQYMSQVKQIENPTQTSEWKRFEETLTLFQKYGEKYAFDALMLAAQGYQESQLDPNAKSPSGAIGVMQVLPDTGRQMKVGDIRITDSNIHAAAKYMDMIISKYFVDAHFTENDRTLFAFACYNCGPGNITKMRKEAVRRGYNPDVWFNNVEIMTAEKIGMETTTYVRNIYKYYVSYKLELEAKELARKARQEVAPGAVR